MLALLLLAFADAPIELPVYHLPTETVTALQWARAERDRAAQHYRELIDAARETAPNRGCGSWAILLDDQSGFVFVARNDCPKSEE